MLATQICRGFTDKQWLDLAFRLSIKADVTDKRAYDADWECAISVFERRITERFLSCIETLEKSDPKMDVEVDATAPADCSRLPIVDATVPGFAIVGLCCLLLETLASFAETSADAVQQPVGPCTYPQGNCIRPESPSGKRIRTFLQRPAFQNAFNDEKTAKKFVWGIRNGILHEAETREWIIWRDEPKGIIVGTEGKRYILNRTAFVDALRQEFKAYLTDLRNPANAALRERFVKKMNDIIKAV